jgi:ABC-type transport system substrate-binding protein
VHSPNLYIFEDKLVGADALIAAAKKSGKFDYDAKLEGLMAIDRYTLQLKLKNPDYGIVEQMTVTQLSAVAREVVEAYGANGQQLEHGASGRNRSVSAEGLAARQQDRAGGEPRVRDMRFPAAGGKDDAEMIRKYGGARLPIVGRVDVSIIEESNPRLLAFRSKEIDFVFIPSDLVNQVVEKGKLKSEYAREGNRLVARARSRRCSTRTSTWKTRSSAATRPTGSRCAARS